MKGEGCVQDGKKKVELHQDFISCTAMEYS